MPINTTKDLFLHELGDIYDAEHRFLEAQQDMHSQATETVLREGIESHIQETQEQIANLEQVFQLLGEEPEREACEAAKGIVLEGQKNLPEAGSDHVRDCLIAGSADRIEHYEICAYRGLIAGAQQMGNEQVERLLQQNLQQEEAAAKKIEINTPMLVKLVLQQEKAS